MDEARDTTRNAGRGALFIAFAKIYFVLMGFVVQFSLPRLLGSAERFGLYSTALVGVSILNNVMVTATLQTVSRFVSIDEAQAEARIRQALVLQGVLGVTLAGAFALAAGPLAALQRDPELAGLFRIASVIVLAYALYATLVGALNGTQRFGAQARFDVSFTTLRTLGILLGAGLGFGVAGAISGFALAASLIAVAAFVVVGTGRPGEPIPLRTWLAFMAPIWIYQVFLNGMLQLDVWIIKRTLNDLALAAGTASEAARDLANEAIGYYRAAQTFAFVPYQLVLSVTFIVFPMVARATAQGDRDAARAAVSQALRFAFLALLSIAMPVAGASDGVLRIAYPPEYLAGADALRVLVLGLVAFTLFVIAASILGGSGRPGLAASIAAVALGVVIVGNRLALEAVGLGPVSLVAAATATSAGMGVAVIGSGVAVYRGFGTFVPLGTALRGSVAGALAAATAFVVPHGSRFTALLALAAGFAVFALALVVLRELRSEEWTRLRRIVGR